MTDADQPPTSLVALLEHDPNPTRRSAPFSFAEVREDPGSWCGRRSACLLIAAKGEWPGLDCRQCRAYQPMDRRERLAEIERLASFGLALARLERDGSEPSSGNTGDRADDSGTSQDGGEDAL